MREELQTLHRDGKQEIAQGRRTYTIAIKHMREVKALIKEMEELGVIEKTLTHYINLLVTVKKQTGG